MLGELGERFSERHHNWIIVPHSPSVNHIRARTRYKASGTNGNPFECNVSTLLKYKGRKKCQV